MRHLFVMVLGAVLVACSSTPTGQPTFHPAASTVTLVPVSYTTTRGADGGQPVANLGVKDQSGGQNNWYRYVEFQTSGERYFGYRSYTLDAAINPATLTSLEVNANFLGPTRQEQTWRWRIYNWSSDHWDWLGNNRGASWNAWTLLTFDKTSNLADYVSGAREIRIRTDSKDASDNADLDYEAVIVSYQTTPPSGWWQPQKGLSWWWQIENTASLNTSRNVDVYDIDLFEGVDTGKINTLKNNGYRVICYFSAGTYEPWRPDADQLFQNDGEAVIPGSSLPQFDEEAWLDIGDTQALETIIKPVMRARLDMAQTAGCDAVEPDNVDGYANGETQGQITAQDQLSYNRWLAAEAHARGLAVGLKNDLGQVDALLDDFDFAVNEQCFAYNECAVYETSFLAANKPVFNQEYYAPSDDPGGSVTQSLYNNQACPYFQNEQIVSLWKTGLNLNGQGVIQCQP